MKKVLIIDTIHPVFEELLNKEGFECTDGTSLAFEEIRNIINQYSGLVIRSRFKLEKDFLMKAPSLRFIARAGAGMENIDFLFAEANGIVCLNAPEANRNAVGEHALAMLLALFNRLTIADMEVRKGYWKREENRGIELKGKTVGIIGFGNMGSAFASLLQSLNVKILAYDKYIKIDPVLYPFVEQVVMADIYEKADILSLHVPLTPETSYLVNKDFLASFKKNIYVINTSRGKVLNTENLVEAMKTGNVSGSCLDVIEYEGVSFEQLKSDQLPEAWHYLIGSDKVILSPHIAGWTFESHRKISEVLAQKIINLFAKNHEKK